MWVANLYKDKGATLASFIIKHNYKQLPVCICMEDVKKFRVFGGICPKLKAIVLKFGIPVIQEKNVINAYRKLLIKSLK